MSTTFPNVLLFSSCQTGNPGITTTDGSFCAAVEQVITTGVAAPVVTKMSVTNERVVCDLSATSKVMVGSKIKIEGASISELNGYFMIEGLVAGGTKFFFTVLGVPDTPTVGGTIVYSYPKPNWEVVAKRPNELVIRSKVASPSRILFYFQEVTTYTGNRCLVAVRGIGYFNNWSDFDTNSMPNRLSTNLVADDYLIVKCAWSPSPANSWWSMVFTDKNFYFIPAAVDSTMSPGDMLINTAAGNFFMGEHKSYIRNDEGAGFIMAESLPVPNNASSSLSSIVTNAFRASNNSSSTVISRFRGSNGLQSKVVYPVIQTNSDESTNAYSGDSNNRRKGYNVFNGELEISKMRLMDTDNNAIIGEIPGIYTILADLSVITRPFALMPGTGQMAGRTLLTVPLSPSTYTFTANTVKSMYFLDLTGPWE